MFDIGINTNNESGKDFSEICNNIKQCGFGSIMVALIRGKEEQQLEYASKSGLKIAYVHLDNLSTNDMWVKGFAHDNQLVVYKKQIELCAKFGVKIAILHPTLGDPNTLVIQPNEFALGEFRELVDFAESKQVKIALENLDNNSLIHFRYLLDNIKSSNFGFCYDVGHHNLYSKNVDLLSLYGDRLIAVHLHDNYGDYEYGDDYSHDLHMVPFDGNVDYANVIQELKECKYKGVLMLEVHKALYAQSRTYVNMTDLEFLNKAKHVAERLRGLLANDTIYQPLTN